MGEWEVRMQKPVRHLTEALTGIRLGSLSASVVATFRISWQGGSSPIGQLATIRQERDRIVVAPFDRSLVPAIVRALQEARQNAYALDPTRLCVSVPPLSGEQRAEIGRWFGGAGRWYGTCTYEQHCSDERELAQVSHVHLPVLSQGLFI